MGSRPTISVVIPMYNAERFIGEAVQSVLMQTLPPDEVIVVDDGSTDNGSSLAGGIPGVKLLRCSHLGIGAATNAGILASTGQYIAFMDADDIWMPDKLEKQHVLLEADPVLDIVFGMARKIFTKADPATGQMRTIRTSRLEAAILAQIMMCQRRDFDRIGLFGERWDQAPFMDWYARALDAGLKILCPPFYFLDRRIHDSNYGLRLRDKQHESYLKTLAMIVRRRQSPRENQLMKQNQ